MKRLLTLLLLAALALTACNPQNSPSGNETTEAPIGAESTTPADNETTTPEYSETTTADDVETTTPEDVEATTPEDIETTPPEETETTTPDVNGTEPDEKFPLDLSHDVQSEKGDAEAFGIDYGTSELYTLEELEAAAALIGEKFASFEGCELHALRYAGDGCDSEENIKWMNELDEATKEAINGDYDVAVLGLYNARFREGQRAVLQALEATERPLIVILLGAPYDAPLVKRCDGLVCAYEYTELAVSTLLEAMEKNSFPGKLPVEL